jgi:hypothetical protein
VTLPGFPAWQGGWSQGRPFFIGLGDAQAGSMLAAGVVALAAVGPGLVPAVAQAQAGDARPVYRCPGPPVLYTDAVSPVEARERNCRVIDGAPLTVTQSARRPAPASVPAAGTPQGSPPATAGGAAAPGGAAPRPEARVDPAVQRARDAEARTRSRRQHSPLSATPLTTHRRSPHGQTRGARPWYSRGMNPYTPQPH